MAEFTVVKEHKNLVTCKPTEFLKQTNRIRKAAEKWLDDTQIMSIRKRKVEGLKTAPAGASAEERAEVIKHNAEMLAIQQRKNLMDILENVLEKCPDETLELLALMCFVEPGDVDNYPVAFYLRNFSEIISDKDVLDFFTSFIQLGQMDTSGQ